MEFNVKALSISAGITAGIVYIACILLFATFPQAVMMAGRSMFHGVEMQASTITAVSATTGFILIVVIALVIGAIFAALYNKFLKK